MCGISGITGKYVEEAALYKMVNRLHHRGPDASGIYVNPSKSVGLGHNRLSIIDLSAAGNQPMSDVSGSLHIVFNGEIYNYLELRNELSNYPYRSQSDTEVILAAYRRWGMAFLDHLIGMFALILWDERAQKLIVARDRFGIKPMFYFQSPDGGLLLASEIKALFEAGVSARADLTTWATYLEAGLYDHSGRTFWKDVHSLPAGSYLVWQNGDLQVSRWYNLVEKVKEEETRPVELVIEEYLALLKESIALRFRSDVPVGINLSGGLDSSILLGLVHALQGLESNVKAFTFITGDPDYDETPWVDHMLEQTHHPSLLALLQPNHVPDLAQSVQFHEDEPFSGIPTLAYARLFELARQEGVIVLLDGNGMDEQWGGYDYYQTALARQGGGLVQGTRQRVTRPECLVPEFCALSVPFSPPSASSDPVRNLQIRDLVYTKIPRATRFNDRISMRASTELREPFLDHRLVELALRQPVERKINGNTSKWLLRKIAARLIPNQVWETPKRPLQTPQREWLRGPLADWAFEQIQTALAAFGGEWLEPKAVRQAWKNYRSGESDNSFYIWQWISLGLMSSQIKSGGKASR